MCVCVCVCYRRVIVTTFNEVVGFRDHVRFLPRNQGLRAQGWSSCGSTCLSSALGTSCGLCDPSAVKKLMKIIFDMLTQT